MTDDVIDYQKFLTNLGGSEEVAKAILHDFLLGMPDIDKKIATLLESLDVSETAKFAHKIRGTTSNFCAAGAISCAKKVSEHAAKGQQEQMRDALIALKSELDHFGLWILNNVR